MKCKYCNAELENGAAVCPDCGKAVETPKKDNRIKAIIAAVACIVLVAALVIVVLVGSGVELGGNPSPTDPTEATLPPDLKSYTAEAEAAKAAAGTVVATVQDKQLTNGELQVYYWFTVYNFCNDNASYLGYYGLDITKPLDQQIYNTEDNTTWQQFFLKTALNTWHRYTAVQCMAEEDGFTLTQEQTAYVQGLAQRTEEMAAAYEYEDVADMLTTEMGPGATLEGFVNYQETSYCATLYIESLYDTLLPTQEEMESYYQENEALFTQYGIGKDAGDVVDVRHILIVPEGGTEDDAGDVTYSEAEYAACYQEASALLEQWKQGEATEQSFAALATTHSEDPGSKGNGGLYEGVTKGYMVEAFDAWIFDEARVYGDTDIVKTPFGYHIMYFVSREPAWEKNASAMLVSDNLSEQIDMAVKKWTMDVQPEKIILGEAILVSE